MSVCRKRLPFKTASDRCTLPGPTIAPQKHDTLCHRSQQAYAQFAEASRSAHATPRATNVTPAGRLGRDHRCDSHHRGFGCHRLHPGGPHLPLPQVGHTRSTTARIDAQIRTDTAMDSAQHNLALASDLGIKKGSQADAYADMHPNNYTLFRGRSVHLLGLPTTLHTQGE